MTFTNEYIHEVAKLGKLDEKTLTSIWENMTKKPEHFHKLARTKNSHTTTVYDELSARVKQVIPDDMILYYYTCESLPYCTDKKKVKQVKQQFEEIAISTFTGYKYTINNGYNVYVVGPSVKSRQMFKKEMKKININVNEYCHELEEIVGHLRMLYEDVIRNTYLLCYYTCNNYITMHDIDMIIPIVDNNNKANQFLQKCKCPSIYACTCKDRYFNNLPNPKVLVNKFIKTKGDNVVGEDNKVIFNPYPWRDLNYSLKTVKNYTVNNPVLTQKLVQRILVDIIPDFSLKDVYVSDDVLQFMWNLGEYFIEESLWYDDENAVESTPILKKSSFTAATTITQEKTFSYEFITKCKNQVKVQNCSDTKRDIAKDIESEIQDAMKLYYPLYYFLYSYDYENDLNTFTTEVEMDCCYFKITCPCSEYDKIMKRIDRVVRNMYK